MRPTRATLSFAAFIGLATIAAVAAGCALPASGLADLPEADAGTGSNTPPAAQPDSGAKGVSGDAGTSSGSSPEAGAPDSATQPSEAGGQQDGETLGMGPTGPMGPRGPMGPGRGHP